MKQNFCTQSGVGLIEVLIAVLVMAIGLLGMAGLQISAKRTNYEAIQRTTAVQLTEDIMSRIRSNSDSINSYVIAAVGGESLGTSTPAVDCATTNCTGTQLATFDLWEWERTLDGASATTTGSNVSGLINPTGCITIVNGFVRVTIAWRGTTVLDQSNIPACGNGKYGTGDLLRQALVLQTFIAGES